MKMRRKRRRKSGLKRNNKIRGKEKQIENASVKTIERDLSASFFS
jgi:hypothetical protein